MAEHKICLQVPLNGEMMQSMVSVNSRLFLTDKNVLYEFDYKVGFDILFSHFVIFKI